VNNKFYDSMLEINFTIHDTKKGSATQLDSRWWLGEPVSGMEWNHAMDRNSGYAFLTL
jgi:hypothetical protein